MQKKSLILWCKWFVWPGILLALCCFQHFMLYINTWCKYVQLLDENNQLIQCIMDFQSKGKTAECSQ